MTGCVAAPKPSPLQNERTAKLADASARRPHLAVATLCGQIEDEIKTQVQKVVIPGKLVIRESTSKQTLPNPDLPC